MTDARAAIDAEDGRLCSIATSSELFNQWIQRSRADIAMMVTETRHGPYPYAGVPWFSTIFGRDGILTALSVLWGNPSLARGVLLSLAATQATSYDPARDAEPGKILHEMRGGEMAALGEVPFGAYYGSVDATPLFILLAGRYYDRTGDLATIKELWPHIEAALTWIDGDGDRDGDGFIEYTRATDRGLAQQGWKDSYDSVFHEDGSWPTARSHSARCRAMCTPRAITRRNWPRHWAIANAAANCSAQAEQLHDAFEDRFWCDDLGATRWHSTDASDRVRCLVKRRPVPDQRHRRAGARGASRRDCDAPGHVFGLGLAHHSGRRSALQPDGVPQRLDLAARHGARGTGPRPVRSEDESCASSKGCLPPRSSSSSGALPELFCGFTRRTGEPPTRYPTACAPQAWASASVFLLIQALLGIDIDARRKRVTFRQPRLPDSLDWLRVRTSSSAARRSMCCANAAARMSASACFDAGATSRLSPNDDWCQ